MSAVDDDLRVDQAADHEVIAAEEIPVDEAQLSSPPTSLVAMVAESSVPSGYDPSKHTAIVYALHAMNWTPTAVPVETPLARGAASTATVKTSSRAVDIATSVRNPRMPA